MGTKARNRFPHRFRYAFRSFLGNRLVKRVVQPRVALTLFRLPSDTSLALEESKNINTSQAGPLGNRGLACSGVLPDKGCEAFYTVTVF